MRTLLPVEEGGRFPHKGEYGILVKELFLVSTIFSFPDNHGRGVRVVSAT